MAHPITPEPIRDAARRVLLDRLLAGALQPGTRINETELAEEFGVSRTPLREALFLLAAEGLIESRPRRGFYVAGLDPDSVRDIYRTLGGLEGLALRASPKPTAKRLGRLRDIDRRRSRRAEGYDPANAIGLDMEWHQVLVSGCPNRLLLELIELCRQRAYRYEYAYVADFGRTGTTGLDQHAGIIAALAAGDLEDAATLLQQHWEYGAESRAKWLSNGATAPRAEGNAPN